LHSLLIPDVSPNRGGGGAPGAVGAAGIDGDGQAIGVGTERGNWHQIKRLNRHAKLNARIFARLVA
jgi:hypothetical protein